MSRSFWNTASFIWSVKLGKLSDSPSSAQEDLLVPQRDRAVNRATCGLRYNKDGSDWRRHLSVRRDGIASASPHSADVLQPLEWGTFTLCPSSILSWLPEIHNPGKVLTCGCLCPSVPFPQLNILRLEFCFSVMYRAAATGDLFPYDPLSRLASIISVDGILFRTIIGSFPYWVQLTFKTYASKQARNCLPFLVLLTVQSCFAYSCNSAGRLEFCAFLELQHSLQRKGIWHGGKNMGFEVGETWLLMLSLLCLP